MPHERPETVIDAKSFMSDPVLAAAAGVAPRKVPQTPVVKRVDIDDVPGDEPLDDDEDTVEISTTALDTSRKPYLGAKVFLRISRDDRDPRAFAFITRVYPEEHQFTGAVDLCVFHPNGTTMPSTGSREDPSGETVGTWYWGDEETGMPLYDAVDAHMIPQMDMIPQMEDE